MSVLRQAAGAGEALAALGMVRVVRMHGGRTWQSQQRGRYRGVEHEGRAGSGEVAVKCFMRIGRKPYDGGDNCDTRCAWLINGECAFSFIAIEFAKMKKKERLDKDDDRR